MNAPRWSDQQPEPHLPHTFGNDTERDARPPIPPGPGWYPNYAVGGAVQWWDGRQWAPPPGPPPPMNVTVAPPQIVVAAAPKSVGIAFLLALLFGPLGMLYSTVAGALVMLAISFVAFFLSLFTFFIPTILCWVVCIVWSCMAASNSQPQSFRY